MLVVPFAGYQLIQWRSQNAEKKYSHQRATTGLSSDSL